MVSAFRLVKEKQYPQPHDLRAGFQLSMDDGSTQYCTTVPWIHHDEAMLASAKYTHPEHASFAETDASNVCAESKVFRMQATVRLTLSQAFLSTNALHALRIGFMPIHGAFEDFDAKDELSGVTVGDILELTKETTDRQTYPIYDNTKLTEKFTNSALLDADEPGLTATQVLENVAFDPDLYYDALNYYMISEKLKKVQDGLRWITLTRDRPSRLLKFNIHRNTKRANPYQFEGVMIFLPKVGTHYQLNLPGDVGVLQQVLVDTRCRYLEWNDNFNHERA